MNKKLIACFMVYLSMTGAFGSVSFAEDNQTADTKPAVTKEVKTEAAATEKNESKTDECCTVGELKPL